MAGGATLDAIGAGGEVPAATLSKTAEPFSTTRVIDDSSRLAKGTTSPSSDHQDRLEHTQAPRDTTPSRRAFLKVASVAAVSAAAGGAVSCKPAGDDGAPARSATAQSGATQRATGFDRATLDAVGDTMLPASLGDGRREAVNAFVAWVDAYDPVAEEMHGYGYADVRYLPPDPAPAWRAQLEGLDILARKVAQKRFHELDDAGRKQVLTMALAHVPGGRLPAPLAATHVAVALVAHWSASPRAWNAAFGADISPNSCRTLDGTLGKPRATSGVRA